MVKQAGETLFSMYGRGRQVWMGKANKNRDSKFFPCEQRHTVASRVLKRL